MWADRRRLAAVLGATVLLVGGVLVSRATGQQDRCEQRQRLAVTVSPDLAPVLTTLGQRLNADEGRCLAVTVTATPPATVLERLQAGSVRPPDVWIPDSTLWLTRAKEDKVAAALDAPSVATSPLVLAGSRATAQHLQPHGRPTMSDLSARATSGTPGPTVTLGAARLSPERVGTIIALQAATAARGDARAALAGLLRSASTTDAPPTERLRDLAGSGLTLVPVPEQAVWAAGAGGTGPLAIYPATASYDYPYAVLSKSATVQAAAGAFLDLLAMPSSQTAIRSAGFRDAQGRPGFDLTPERGVDGTQAADTKRLDALSLDQAEHTLAAVKLDARLLAVVDVSGSMAWGVGGPRSGGPSRLAIAAEAAGKGMALYPDATQVGLWAFSDASGGRPAYTEVVPTTTLDVAGRARLGAGLATLRPAGDTALYSTTLAAVRAVQGSWVDGRVNAVVVLSDGADTERAMSLERLVATLTAERHAARPVPVITVAFGPDADAAALAAISRATGGASYRADDADQVLAVFLDAMGQRACRPDCP